MGGNASHGQRETPRNDLMLNLESTYIRLRFIVYKGCFMKQRHKINPKQLFGRMKNYLSSIFSLQVNPKV